MQGDMWDAIGEDEVFDLIVSNPPYIPSIDVDALDKRVKDFEPRIALDGDKDGLKFYRIIAEQLANHLKENGVLIVEFGINQAKSITKIFKNYKTDIIKDMEGVERIALVSKA